MIIYFPCASKRKKERTQKSFLSGVQNIRKGKFYLYDWKCTHSHYIIFIKLFLTFPFVLPADPLGKEKKQVIPARSSKHKESLIYRTKNFHTFLVKLFLTFHFLSSADPLEKERKQKSFQPGVQNIRTGKFNLCDQKCSNFHYQTLPNFSSCVTCRLIRKRKKTSYSSQEFKI